MGEFDDMRAIIEASIIADSRHGEKIRALDALYHLRARAEAAEQRAEAAEREVEHLRAAMEAREFDRDAEDLYEAAEEAEQLGTPRGRERARRLIKAAEAAEAKANAIMAKVNTASGPLKAEEVSDGR